MTYEAIGKLAERGGIPLVILVLAYLLLRFMATRGVKAFDRMGATFQANTTQITTSMTNAMREMATAVGSASEANTKALGLLTERVSRMEGKVDAFGMAAVGGDRRDAVEMIRGEDTGTHEIPILKPPRAQTQPGTRTPPGGRPAGDYHQGRGKNGG